MNLLGEASTNLLRYVVLLKVVFHLSSGSQQLGHSLDGLTTDRSVDLLQHNNLPLEFFYAFLSSLWVGYLQDLPLSLQHPQDPDRTFSAWLRASSTAYVGTTNSSPELPPPWQGKLGRKRLRIAELQRSPISTHTHVSRMKKSGGRVTNSGYVSSPSICFCICVFYSNINGLLSYSRRFFVHKL